MKVKVDAPRFDSKTIDSFTQELNRRSFKLTQHGANQLRSRYGDRLKEVALLLRDALLDSKSVFEYELAEEHIESACYEVPLSDREAVHLSVNKYKELVTVWPVYYALDKQGNKKLVLTN